MAEVPYSPDLQALYTSNNVNIDDVVTNQKAYTCIKIFNIRIIMWYFYETL